MVLLGGVSCRLASRVVDFVLVWCVLLEVLVCWLVFAFVVFCVWRLLVCKCCLLLLFVVMCVCSLVRSFCLMSSL